MSTSSRESQWREALQERLTKFLGHHPMGSADGLYDPIHYLMSLGGKRIRPVLALAACEAEGGQMEEAMPAAMAIELFHNFTLMHDDIMDSAILRRGKTTVHEKWDVNTAILSGDAMLIKAYQCLDNYPSGSLFSKRVHFVS